VDTLTLIIFGGRGVTTKYYTNFKISCGKIPIRGKNKKSHSR
jgi:hypothetical protein